MGRASSRSHGFTVAAVLALALCATSAHAYDFEVDARTEGQGYQMRWFRNYERDRVLNRRRFTQTLSLNIYDILQPAVDPGHPERPRAKSKFDLYFTSQMRFDNDFGSYMQGDVTYPLQVGTQTERASAAVPELGNYDLDLDILYAYVGGRHLFGFLDFMLGRQLTIETLDWYSFDGLTLRAKTPLPVTVEAIGGLLVRDSSPFGAPQQEVDGTSSSQCQVFTNDPVLGGMWVPGAECSQRKALMPTFGFAAETTGLHHVQARLAYRRSQSETGANFAAAGGFLPAGALPAWGVNEEKLSATIRGNFFGGGIVPWVNARYNFLFAGIDELQAGVRLAWATHAVSPELVYSYPTFDGDSIFNVFAVEPYTDARLTYEVWPHRGALRAYARGYVRQFSHHDTDHSDANFSSDLATCGTAGNLPCLNNGQHLMGTTVNSSDYAEGASIGARLKLADRGRARVDLFYETGYGGLKAGGDSSATYRVTRDVNLEGRLSIIRFEEDAIEALKATTFGLQGGARWMLGPGMALHLLLEENVNRFENSQLRVIGVLDLAFRPEY